MCQPQQSTLAVHPSLPRASQKASSYTLPRDFPASLRAPISVNASPRKVSKFLFAKTVQVRATRIRTLRMIEWTLLFAKAHQEYSKRRAYSNRREASHLEYRNALLYYQACSGFASCIIILEHTSPLFLLGSILTVAS